MAKKAYPRRYAQAIFEIALERKELEKWQADLQNLAVAVADAGFLAVLENPKLKLEDKIQMVLKVLGDQNPLAFNLLSLLIARGSIGIVREIAAEYEKLLNNYRGVETAEVLTAVPLDENDLQKLTERIGSLVGKKVVLKTEVDPALIGGIVARVDGKLLDGSTRSKLEALRRELLTGERKR
jgi:F-type H+-transporting ATPase subunit delta